MAPAAHQERFRIGIVVPAFNAARFLGATLESISAQTFGHWRCVVVDDGSSDDTVAVAQAVADGDDRITVVSQPNAGPCVARNHGFDQLGDAIDYVTFMDADDVWAPHALATLVEAIVAHPGVIGAHALADFIDEQGAPLMPGVFADQGRHRLGCRGGRPRPWPADQPTTFENIVLQSILFPPGLILAEAAAYRRVGLFDPSLVEADDWDVLIRIARLGDLAFVDEVILGYRRHDTNLGTGAGRAQGCADAFRQAFYSPDNSPAQRKIVRDAWRAQNAIDARNRGARGWQDLRAGHLVGAAASLARLPVFAARYLRGRPGQRRAAG